jgi:NADH-quinone oxidoreductase subunit J
MIANIAFYVFALILLAAAAMVVTARNPVHSVLFLILAFFNAAALFLIAGAEFLAMILVIVYVGAVAVLFMFVVMMLDVDFAELRSGYQRYVPVGAAIGFVLCVELLLVLAGWRFAPLAVHLPLVAGGAPALTNTAALGRVLYTQYVFLFQASGLVLLVAMIGAIVLTLRDQKTSRHQSVRAQQDRSMASTLEMVDAGLGLGVNTLGIYRPKPAMAEPASAHGAPATHDAHGGAGHDQHAHPETH